MKIAVRMDDISPDMDWEKFYLFRDLFARTGIEPLLGIVPMNEDNNLHIEENKASFWDEMKQLQEQGYTLALHGYRHVYQTSKGGLFPLNNFSEFAGRTYEEQLADLKQARKILDTHGIQTDIFMAPAHSYDRNTLRALKATGFHKITDGFGKKPYLWNGITFYPISFLLSRSLKADVGYTTMVVHANTVTDFQKYEEMFREHGKDMISYHEYMKVMPVKKGFSGRIGEFLLAKLKFTLVKLKG